MGIDLIFVTGSMGPRWWTTEIVNPEDGRLGYGNEYGSAAYSLQRTVLKRLTSRT